ncbi:conserved hypothetical protein [Escherichia coli B354]|nr:conserved hypothetical protein [Escherichia coli B354]
MPPALHNATSGKCLDYQQMSGLAPLRPMKQPRKGYYAFFNIHSISVSVMRRSNCNSSSFLQA